MNERLDQPEPVEATYNVEVLVLVRGIRAMNTLDARRLAIANLRDGEVIDTDPYIEETDHDDLDD